MINFAFDLGNTLKPSTANAMEARREAARKFGIPQKFPSIYSDLRKRNRARPMKDDEKNVFREALSSYGKYDVDDVYGFIKRRYRELEEMFYETSGILMELKKLQKSFGIYIFSNNSEKCLEKSVEMMSKHGFVPDGCVSSEKLGVEKHVHVFIEGCKKFNIKCKESAYFGDSAVDFPSAKAGMTFVLVRRYSAEKIENARAIDFVNAKEIRKVLP